MDSKTTEAGQLLFGDVITMRYINFFDKVFCQ